jgi:hypothetical protein
MIMITSIYLSYLVLTKTHAHMSNLVKRHSFWTKKYIIIKRALLSFFRLKESFIN